MGRLTHTVSGSIATVRSPAVAPIESLKVHFSPIQEGTGDPSPSNVCPITGWTGVTGYKGGKNLLNAISSNIVPFNDSNFSNYTLNDGNIIMTNATLMGFKVKCKPSTKYTYSLSSSIDLFIEIGSFTEEPTIFSNNSTFIVNATASKSVTFTTRSDTEWIVCIIYAPSNLIDTSATASNFQLEVGSTATSYEGYSAPTSYPVSWESQGTVYGGYVDLVTGNIIKEYGIRQITGYESNITWQNYNNQVIYTSDTVVPGIYKDGSSEYIYGFCNLAKQYNGHLSSISTNNNSDGQGIGFSNLISVWGAGEISVEAVINMLKSFTDNGNPLTIVYKLATPQLIATLTPQELETFKGYSNFWSNAGDVDVTYQVVESSEMTKERQKIFAGNAPTIHTASGSVANFEMEPGLNRNLKSCKVGFLPVQEGSGDTSPSNTRQLISLNNFNAIKCNKNIFDPTCRMFSQASSTYSIASNGTITQSQSDGRGWTDNNFEPIFMKAGTYRFSCSDGGTINLRTSLDNYDSNIQKTNGGGIITLESDCYVRFKHAKNSNNSYPVTFTLQIELGSTATDYEAYSGVIYPISLPNIVKNLFDETYPNIDNSSDGSVYYRSIYVGEGSFIMSTNAPLNENSFSNLFFISGEVTTGASTSSNGVYVGRCIRVNSTNGYVTIGYRNFANMDPRNYWVQIEKGVTPTVRSQYHRIYGGYIDLITGEIYKTWNERVLMGYENFYMSDFYIKSDACDVYVSATNSVKYNTSNILSNKLATSSKDIWGTVGYPNQCKCNATQLHLNIANDLIGVTDYTQETQASVKQKVNNYLLSLCENDDPLVVYYELATPELVTTLTPTQIQALKGTNNILSDANGTIEVKYWSH